jgi:hypothetical protein
MWLLFISYDSTLQVPELLVFRLETYYTIISCYIMLYIHALHGKLETSDK